jgi:hypothetical protein
MMASLKATLRNLEAWPILGDVSRSSICTSVSVSGNISSSLISVVGGRTSSEGIARRESPSTVGVLGKSES